MVGLKRVFAVSIFVVLWLLVSSNLDVAAQKIISVHFLYGSKPAKGFEATEPRWFGGKRGGHVGIEVGPDQVLNFGPSGKFHWFSNDRKRHSHFTERSVAETFQVLGKSEGSLQTVSIEIPLDSGDFAHLREIRDKYLAHPPYDYAFIGMRCASASDEILAKIGLTKRRSFWGTVFGTFRPRALRTRLLRKAAVLGWKVSRQDGSDHRIWEKDRR
jgi:hypothetical protein